MKWSALAQYSTNVLAVLLIVRLFLMRGRLEKVYSVFSAFLAVQLTASSAFLLLRALDKRGYALDYRPFWFFFTLLVGSFSLWLVYELSTAVLHGVPGVLNASRTLLKFVFPGAIVFCAGTAPSEYSLIKTVENPQGIFGTLVVAGFVLDRAVSMAALIVLFAILGFILWFPVSLPRNLAVFSLGLVVYFSAKTGLALIQSYISPNSRAFISTSISFVLVASFIYWLSFVNLKGQAAQVRIGHRWRTADHTRLLDQLDSMNAALLRTGRQLEH